MDTQEYLDAFRSSRPECTVAGLVDISSGIVLCVTARRKKPQEYFDALCVLASEVFSDENTDALAQMQPAGAGDVRHESIVTVGDETCLFLQSLSDPAEAMFCMCSGAFDVSATLAEARSRLHYLEQEQM